MSMKVLIGLNALQMIAIAVLIVIVAGHRDPIQPQSNGADLAMPQGQAANNSFQQSGSTQDEARLRSIIREELALVLQGGNRSQDVPAKASPPDLQTAAQIREQSQFVAQKIEGYKGVGAVSNRQMQELLSEIDQLDEPNRAQMMSLLARAINTGALKGRL